MFGLVFPTVLEPPPPSSPRLKCSTGAFLNSGSRFEPSWAHLKIKALQTHICEALCFSPVWRQDLVNKDGGNDYLS